MRIVLAVLMTVVVAASAQAQGHKRPQTDTPAQNDDQKKKRAADEKAYKSAIEKLPDKKYDPWAKVR